jgi:DNA-binding MarR family transcriptional regulator
MNALSPVQDCAYTKLRRLMRCVAQHFDSELAKAGLKTTQLGLLSEILRLQPVRPGDLARAVGIDPSTLTRNLKPLMSAGWVELGAGPDARTRTIRITDSGRAKQAQAQRRLRMAQRSMDEKLGASRVTELKALMDESLDILAIPP